VALLIMWHIDVLRSQTELSQSSWRDMRRMDVARLMWSSLGQDGGRMMGGMYKRGWQAGPRGSKI
jgi:hypothetical protein